MRQCLLDDLIFGRGGGIAFPGVMPELQYRTGGNVGSTIGQGIDGVDTPIQKTVQVLVYRHGIIGGLCVHIVQIYHAVIVVVDVKQLVVV